MARSLPPQALASRLRLLRTGTWPSVKITQRMLAVALGDEKPLADATISAYESGATLPPDDRLKAYATFFATERSVANGEPRLLRDRDLSDTERRARDALAPAHATR